MLDATTAMSPRRGHSDNNVQPADKTSSYKAMLSLEQAKWEEEKTMRDKIVQEMRVEIETVRREVELMEQQVSAKGQIC